MSSAPELQSSVEYMAEIGVVTNEYVKKTEHCVDDAVYALGELTDFIAQNPEVEAAIKQAVLNKKKNDVLNSDKYDYIGSQDVFSSYVLPSAKDAQFCSESINGSLQIKDVFVSSESLGIEKTLIGVTYITDTLEQRHYLNTDATERLNQRFDYGK